MFIGCPVVPFVRSFVQSDIVPMMSHELLEQIFDETDREYSLAPTDDLIRFWRSRSQQADLHM